MSGGRCFDQSWSLLLPVLPDLQTFPPCRVRPNDHFDRQLYLESFCRVQTNKVLGILAQAVESDDGQSVAIHKILEKNIPNCENIDRPNSLQFCIDEVASKLYLIFRGIKEGRRGERTRYLSVSSLSFGPPDRFGQRRVTLSDNPGRMYKINFGEELVITSPRFFPHPKSGELLCVGTLDPNGPSLISGKLDLDGARSRTVDVQILDKFDPGFYVAEIYSFRFMNKGKYLAIFNWSVGNLLQGSTEVQSLVQMFAVDGEFKLDRNIFCDQRLLLANIYPPGCRLEVSNSSESFQNKMIKLVSKGIRFQGHTFKYTVLCCHDGMGVALVKNFNKWFQVGLCPTKTRHCFLSFKTPNLFREIYREVEKIFVANMLGSTLYYAVRREDQTTFHRLELGDHFKDYRTCSYCGMKERRKRHNAQGKRIAKFKVCRDCKKLNLHHQWWKFPCHYCSLQCMKKGWEEHKKQH